MDTLPTSDTPSSPKRPSRLRPSIALILGLLAAGYLLAIVLGYLPESRRVDAPSIAVTAILILAIIVALRPDLMDRFKGMEVSGFKIEMLERVREKQAQQAVQLEDMSLMLPLLLPATERKHLLNLASGRTSNYKGTHSLRSELRRLRSLDLIEMKNDKHVSMMKDNTVFDLQEFVGLTRLGKGWAKRITEIERRESDTPDDDSSVP